MPPVFTGVSEDMRSQLAHLRPQVSARANLAAGIAILALLAQLLLAQLTLLITIVLVAADRLARWRPAWLAIPGALGVAWVLSAGVRHALTGYLAGAGQVIGQLGEPGPALARLARLSAALHGWQRWLPGQAPVALAAGAAQAAMVTRVPGPGSRAGYRAGLAVLARRAYAAAAIRRGETATAAGGCVGVDRATGRAAEVSWREAESGVLCTGQDGDLVTGTGYRLAAAAIQRRKAVIIVDLAGAGGAWQADAAAGLLAAVAGTCAAAGAPLGRLGHDGRYQPLHGAAPGRAADLVLAMTDWRASTHAEQRFCAAYLNAALAVIALTPGPPGPCVLSELTGLLVPAVMRARLATLAGAGARPGWHEQALSRAAGLARQLEAEPGLIRPVAAQLGALRSASIGRWLVGNGQEPISLSMVISQRRVAFFDLDRCLHGRAAIAVARLVVADLTAVLADRAALGVPADCLAWINGAELLDPRQLAALVAAGAASGTAVLLGTTACAAARRLASDVNVIVACGPVPPPLAAMLGQPSGSTGGQGRPPAATGAAGRRLGRAIVRPEADNAAVRADELVAQHPDELSVLVRAPSPRALLRCWAVR
jgi:hypothetical protein